MKADLALATAIAASFTYVIVVGAVNSNNPAALMSPHKPVHMTVTHKDSGRVVEIDDAVELHAVTVWLDQALSHPRSLFDMRIFSPPSNQLDITFASGEHSIIYFSSGGPSRAPQSAGTVEAPSAATPAMTTGARVVLQFDGEYFVAHELPELLRGTDTEPEPGVVKAMTDA